MVKETLTVHEALAELKMLDNRIIGHINEANFAIPNRRSNTKINGKSIEEFVADEEANYQSILDLIRRRKAIRNALSQSNAITKVTIGGQEYTIAEAIEMKKTGMSASKLLVNALTNHLNSSQSTASRDNDRLSDRADQYIIGLMGSKEKANSADAIAIRQAYVDANTTDIVSISNISNDIKTLQDFIAVFEAEVDAKISISNALTTIEFEY